jgi:hypothetical protein
MRCTAAGQPKCGVLHVRQASQAPARSRSRKGGRRQRVEADRSKARQGAGGPGFEGSCCRASLPCSVHMQTYCKTEYKEAGNHHIVLACHKGRCTPLALYSAGMHSGCFAARPRPRAAAPGATVRATRPLLFSFYTTALGRAPCLLPAARREPSWGLAWQPDIGLARS